MDFLDLFLVSEKPPRHHVHDPLEPTLVDARHVPVEVVVSFRASRRGRTPWNLLRMMVTLAASNAFSSSSNAPHY